MESNPQLKLAEEYLHYTNQHVFLTGKAGTGKTTFLRELKKGLPKRMVIVAPTGVAAINAGGATIHSFFQLPFGPYIPDTRIATTGRFKFGKEKIALLKSMDVLVIDEISMVRADVLDAIDEVLRTYRTRSQPFGGVQLLMIGDLYQLPPVVKDEEWSLLSAHYDSMYFFSSVALKQSNFVKIELQHIYRQNDAVFIDLLNQVRNNRLNSQGIELLNSRYQANFIPAEEAGFITLTTHNGKAQSLNNDKLGALKGKDRSFSARITGDFPASSFPTEETLELKVGSQVMFVKNDASRDKRYYNGKIGHIVRIGIDVIAVKCKGEFEEIEVERETWQNVRYVLDADSKEIKEEIIGEFEQFPLKLAWAITIHKSQGLTFDKVIIDAGAAFAHGQVYVALSRCKSLEGIVLSSRISPSSVRTDASVSFFSAEAAQNAPTEQQLSTAKRAYQASLLFELFDWKPIQAYLKQWLRVIEEHSSIIVWESGPSAVELLTSCEQSLVEVGEKFLRQLHQMILEVPEPEADESIQERVVKAVHYFLPKQVSWQAGLEAIAWDTDNSSLKNSLKTLTQHIELRIAIKIACLRTATTGFQTNSYLRAKADAEVAFMNAHTNTEEKKVEKESGAKIKVQHGKLYMQLKEWRDEVAAENNVLDYMVFPVKTLIEIANELPVTVAALAKIKGIGKTKSSKYGEVIINMVLDYCLDNNIEIDTVPTAIESPKVKVNTKEVTLNLWKEGKTQAEIAKERGVTIATVETHLLHFVGEGELSVFDLFPSSKIRPIIDFIEVNRNVGLADLKAKLGDSVSYSEIKAALAHIQSEEY